MMRSDSTADDSLIGIQIVAGTGGTCVVREGCRGQALELVGDENLKLVGVIDVAALVNVPVGRHRCGRR